MENLLWVSWEPRENAAPDGIEKKATFKIVRRFKVFAK